MASIAINAQGSTVAIGDGASPLAYVTIGGARTFSGIDGERPDIDTTDLASTTREFLLGLQDNGNWQIEGFRDDDDTGQARCETLRGGTTIENIRITLPNGDTYTQPGYVKSFSIAGGVDEPVSFTLGFRSSGDVTIVTA